MEKRLYIKNMVCQRCIRSVADLLDQLNIPYSDIQLGHVELKDALDASKKMALKKALSDLGFEWLEEKNEQLIARIKAVIIEEIHYHHFSLNINFSTYLAEKLQQDYTALSKLFSSQEGITIEKYILLQKIEKVKELMAYGEMTLSEIANKLHYSSVAHLSSQFKKVTGMTPTAYKKMEYHHRKPLDKV